MKVKIDYRTFNSNGISLLSAMDYSFDSIPRQYSLQQIIDATSESSWYAHLLHNNKESASSYGYELNTEGKIWNVISPKSSKNSLQTFIKWNYQKQNTVLYNQSSIIYSALPNDYRHQYSRSPLSSYNLSAEVNYGYWVAIGCLSPSVSYKHQFHSSDRSLFQLQRLDHWREDALRKLTDLPSTRDSLLMATDAKNSYFSSTYDNTVNYSLNFQNELPLKKGRFSYDVTFPIEVTHTKLFYRRGVLDESCSRNLCFFQPIGGFTFRDDFRQYGLTYHIHTQAPSLVYRMNITDDANPLNIQLGNDNLKNTTAYNVTCNFGRYNLPYQGNFNTDLVYQAVTDALAMGFLYDTQTGVRTTRPDNINGNWSLSGHTRYNRTIGKKERFSLDSRTGYSYLHSVDLTGTTVVERSKVNTFNLNEELSVKYKLGKNEVGMKGKVEWSNIVSDRDNFRSINVTDFSYGLTALIQLPWKFQLNTDLTMYSRRGYESASMNTDDLVWNGRLSRTFLNGSLTCYVDGFDILGNLSNVYRTVNAQGRIETRYNVVPRYIMAHVIYHLNKQPKKKQE